MASGSEHTSAGFVQLFLGLVLVLLIVGVLVQLLPLALAKLKGEAH